MRRRFPVLAGALLALVLVAACVAAAVSRNPAATAFSPPAQGVGSSVVTLSTDAVRSDQGENVRSLLQRHFDAINTRDYAGWSNTVVPERSERLAEDAWRTNYSTTADGSVHVERIDVGPPGTDGRTTLLVMLRFVSTQDQAFAPEQAKVERLCWHNTLPLTGAPWRIGLTEEENSTREAC